MAQIAYITTAGQAAITDAQFYGYKIDLVRFQISDTLITETDPAIIRSYTALPGTVAYDSGNYPTNGTLTYQVTNETGIVITIYLNSSIGDFTLGSAGLFLSDGTLFAILKLEATYEKTMNIGNVAGNTVAFPFVFVITLQEVLNLTVLPEGVASLPIVATEDDLPNFLVAPYSNYFIQEYANSGQSAIACKFFDEWQFCLASKQDLFESWLKVDPASFDLEVVEGDVVYYNVITSKWSLLDGQGIEYTTIGIRQGDGVKYNSFYFREDAFLIGTDYYVDSYPSVGKLTTLASKYFLGTAFSSSILAMNPRYIDDTAELEPPLVYQAYTDVNDIYVLIADDEGAQPTEYFEGLTVSFVAPTNSILNQKVKVGSLDPVSIYINSASSGTHIGAGEMPSGSLVTLEYLGVDNGFRYSNSTALPSSQAQAIAALNSTSFISPLTLQQVFDNNNFLGAAIRFNGGGVFATVLASKNVTSVTRLGGGNYRINFTTPMPNANYYVVGLAQFLSFTSTMGINSIPLTTSVEIQCQKWDNANFTSNPDLLYINLIIIKS